nr:MAG TPA: hypothetical protein [Caudoviricetes sp.]
MNVNLTNNLSFETNYNLKLVREDKLIQEVNTHNVINMQRLLVHNSKSGFISYLSIGQGTGTPTKTDTSLFKVLWDVTPSLLSEPNKINRHYPTEEDPNTYLEIIGKFKVPATSQYTGTITELGIGYNTQLLTHALIRNTEGNPISINKTDIDVLFIEITLKIFFKESEYIKIQKNCLDVYSVVFRPQYRVNLRDMLSGVEVLWNTYNVIEGKTLSSLSEYMAQQLLQISCTTYIGGCSITNEGKLSINNLRLGNNFDNGEQNFIMGLCIGKIFIIEFPNENIFPRYEIKNIKVGTGDGVKKEFECPMNYFIPETDKIYINGVLQNRNTDYTLDPYNNNQGVPELMACNKAKITGGISSNYIAANIFNVIKNNAYVNSSSTSDTFSPVIYRLDVNHPLYIDMQKETRVNYLQLGCLQSEMSSYNINVTLYVSDTPDGEYTEVCTINKDAYTPIPNDNYGIFMKFPTINKRYFKVTTTNNEYALVNNFSYNWSLVLLSKGTNFLLGYIGEGIKFINPPAEGDVITMEASTDLPMKNNNFVFDVNMEIQLWNN